MLTLTPVKRQGLVQTVADDLREAIVDRKLDEQGLLPSESDLAKTFGVSRSVIREAVRQLEVQGLVETRQGRRSRIRKPDPTVAADGLHLLLQRCQASQLQLLEVRRTLEIDIAGLAAKRRSAAQLTQLNEAVGQQEHATSMDDKVHWDLCFHLRLAEATGNPLYCQMLAALGKLFRSSMSQTIEFHGGVRSVTGHRRIVTAVKKRLQAEARKAMRAHLIASERDHLRLSCTDTETPKR